MSWRGMRSDIEARMGLDHMPKQGRTVPASGLEMKEETPMSEETSAAKARKRTVTLTDNATGKSLRAAGAERERPALT